jgi:hypothetical protein
MSDVSPFRMKNMDVGHSPHLPQRRLRLKVKKLTLAVVGDVLIADHGHEKSSKMSLTPSVDDRNQFVIMSKRRKTLRVD